MAELRTLTSSIPSSNVKTPAAHSAVYSPSDSPATAPGRSAASCRTSRSLWRPAMPARNMHGWQTLVSCSLSSGPLRHASKGSKPSTRVAVATILMTSGSSFRSSSIFTYCEPCPGKSSPIVVFGSAPSAPWTWAPLATLGAAVPAGPSCSSSRRSGHDRAISATASCRARSQRWRSSDALLTSADAAAAPAAAASTSWAAGRWVDPKPPRRVRAAILACASSSFF
mmetsp:Transcript_95391/g.246552  ORF Transcript_95391/g.246552 Transcript_95391/m.246552 type:complete len:226 (+) Transcript_95391:629-1306(+)